MAKKHNPIAREAINIIKNAYLEGIAFASIWTIQKFVIHKLGVKPTGGKIKLTVDQVRGWERQARLELADGNVAVTTPTRRNDYERKPNPTAEERVYSYGSRIKYMATLINNELRIAKANAAQSDATRTEIIREAQLSIVAPMLRQLAEDANVG